MSWEGERRWPLDHMSGNHGEILSPPGIWSSEPGSSFKNLWLWGGERGKPGGGRERAGVKKRGLLETKRRAGDQNNWSRAQQSTWPCELRAWLL